MKKLNRFTWSALFIVVYFSALLLCVGVVFLPLVLMLYFFDYLSEDLALTIVVAWTVWANVSGVLILPPVSTRTIAFFERYRCSD